MSSLTYDIALVFIPGLLCAKLYFTLTTFRRPGYAEMAGYSLVLGFLCYLLWSVVMKVLLQFDLELLRSPYLERPTGVSRLVDPKLSLRASDIIAATVASLPLALAISWLKNHRTLFRFSATIGASLRYSTDSVFVEFGKLAQNQYVRIWKSERLAYEGVIHLFYEHTDMYEVVLTDVEIVQVGDQEDGTPKGENLPDSPAPNSIDYIYVRWNKADDVLIELTDAHEPTEESRATTPSDKAGGLKAFAQGAAKWLRARWSRTRPAIAPSKSPGPTENET